MNPYSKVYFFKWLILASLKTLQVRPVIIQNVKYMWKFRQIISKVGKICVNSRFGKLKRKRTVLGKLNLF